MDYQILESLARNWRKPLGLWLALLVFAIASSFLWRLPAHLWPIIFAGVVAVVFAWYWSRRLPRIRTEKVGFGLALRADESEGATRFAADFSDELSRLMRAGETGATFQFLRVPDHGLPIDSAPTDEVLKDLMIRLRTSFLLYAHVRIRRQQGAEQTLVDLKAFVRHERASEVAQRNLQREFSELLPSRIQMTSDAEVLNFTVTGEMTVLVAKYIIGIAAAISGLADYAEQLQTDVQNAIDSSQIHGLKLHTTLRTRVPERLMEIRSARADFAFRLWLESQQAHYLEIVEKNVRAYPMPFASSPASSAMRAIVAFVCERDAEKALKILNEKGVPRDAVWHYNAGFLHAYKGNMKKAGQLYNKALEMNKEPDLAARLEDFISIIVGREPDKVQLRYCLGRLNFDVKGDMLRAGEEFRYFVQNAPSGSFTVELEHAKQWLSECDVVDREE